MEVDGDVSVAVAISRRALINIRYSTLKAKKKRIIKKIFLYSGTTIYQTVGGRDRYLLLLL